MPAEDVINLPKAWASSQNNHRLRELQKATNSYRWDWSGWVGETAGDCIFQKRKQLLVQFGISKVWSPQQFWHRIAALEISVSIKIVGEMYCAYMPNN